MSSDSSIQEIANWSAVNMYKNGSDSRQQKNGKPNKLVEECLKKKTISTIGVYAYYLNDEQRKIITSNEKSQVFKRLSLEFMREIAIAINKGIDEMITTDDVKKARICVYIPISHQKEMMDALIEDKTEGLYKYNDIRLVFDPRKLFFNQERTKVNSMYGIRVK
jgi:hypothetical protein